MSWFFNRLVHSKPGCLIFNCVSFKVSFVMTKPVGWFSIKSLIDTTNNGFFAPFSKFDSRFSVKASKSSWIWLGDLQREKKFQAFSAILSSKNILPCKYWTLRILKGKKLLYKIETPPLFCWQGGLDKLRCTQKFLNCYHQKEY